MRACIDKRKAKLTQAKLKLIEQLARVPPIPTVELLAIESQLPDIPGIIWPGHPPSPPPSKKEKPGRKQSPRSRFEEAKDPVGTGAKKIVDDIGQVGEKIVVSVGGHQGPINAIYSPGANNQLLSGTRLNTQTKPRPTSPEIEHLTCFLRGLLRELRQLKPQAGVTMSSLHNCKSSLFHHLAEHNSLLCFINLRNNL